MKKEAQRILIEGFKRYVLIKGYAKNYVESVGTPLKECLAFMNERGLERLEDIDSEAMKVYHEHLECRPSGRGGILSPFTITSYFFTLKLFFDYAQRTDLVQVNPMNILHYPRPQNKARSIISKAAVTTLYKACQNEQERAILALFYGCGLRRAEGVKLNIKDLDFRSGLLYIRKGKGNKRRVIPMSVNVINDLKTYYHDFRGQQISRYTQNTDSLAFMLNQKGTKMKGNTYHLYFKRIVKRSKIEQEISLHNLRHSIATHLLAEGMKIEKVRDFLGHRYLETTQLYTRISKAQLEWE